MRTAILILATVVLLAGGFATYWSLQSPDVVRNDAAADAAKRQAKPVAATDSTYTVRGGKDVWLKQFDESRRLTNQFRAEEFNPQKDGSVLVTKPEAHFFLKGGQWIRVTGETGDVVVTGMPEAGGDPFAGGGASAAPSRGRLKNVHLQLYETLDAPAPTLDMEMNNAAFDNESFRIFTEGYTDESGTSIAADQVKLTVRGKYEFDGRGLTIRWNDRDRRLELLEVAHGERLVVKDPGSLGTGLPERGPAPGKASAAARRQSPEGEVGAADAEHRPVVPGIELASADPAAAAGAASAASSGVRDGDSTLYSIWFYDNVQVVQEDQTLATGSVIEVYYAMRDEPAQRATAPSLTRADAAPQPAPATNAALQEASAPQAEATAQTQPAEVPAQPVIIYWTGKLRIVPSETEPPVQLAAGQSAVQMRGAPVVLTRENVQIRCPAFTYRTADGGVALRSSDAFPQVEIVQFANLERTGKPALTLLSEWVEYAPKEGVATLGGKSRAIFPAGESGTPADAAQASWTYEGIARFTGSGDKTVLQALALNGDVDVQHPQLSLKAQRLNLAFDAPATTRPAPAAAGTKPAPEQPVVRQIVADENVHCVLEDEGGVPRELHADHLEIGTATDPAGKLYPKVVNATGNVLAKDADSELAAQELALLLAPAMLVKKEVGKSAAQAAPAKQDSAKPAPVEKNPAKADPAKADTAAVVLERMIAKTGVRAVSKGGDVATGDTLVVTVGPDGKPQVGLGGTPAKVENADGTVMTSEKIAIPNGDQAEAVGPGSLRAPVKDADPAAPRRYMNVSWTTSALVNANLTENQVQIVGAVKATMPDKDGTVNTSSAERMLISLVDKPVNPAAPMKAPATRKSPATRKTDKDGGPSTSGTLAATDVDVMKGKEIGRILLNKDAVVTSRLSAADGSVLREMRLSSSLLEYDARTQQLSVPRPGQMLVRDHSPPDVKLDAKPASDQAPEGGLSSQRGATAFRWAEALDYSGVAKRAAMKGDVLVAYKPDDEREVPVNLRADEVIATFEAATRSTTKPATAKATPGDTKIAAVQLRGVRAEGNVTVVRGVEELSAPRLTYDPITHWIRATGNETVPAVFSSTGRSDSVSAREFQWNTETWKIRVIDAAGRSTGR